MKQGEHGRRNETKVSILIEVISGNNTATGLKDAMCKRSPTDLTRVMAESLNRFNDKLPDAEQLDDERRRIRDNLNKTVISTKDVEYHLRTLVDKGLLVKSEGRYYPNRRSNKAIDAMLSLLQSRNEYEIGISAFMQSWADISSISIVDAVRYPLDVAKEFFSYMVSFMSETTNLKDFVRAWGYSDNPVKTEMGNRFIEFLKSNHDGSEINLPQNIL